MNRLATVMSFVLVLALGQASFAADSALYGKLARRSIGPAVSGGRAASVAGVASIPKLYYIGSAGGGVWKTANGGETWEPVFEKQGVSAIGAVSIAPLDENIVWVGTGESNPRNDVSYGDGVYKTTDGGKTWKNMGLAQTRHISRIAIDPKNPKHVVVAAQGDVFKNSTERGVYVTTDGGATWQKTLYIGPQSGASDLIMAPEDPNIVYAGMWQFQLVPWTFTSGGTEDGLYKSIDGGMTWNRLTGHGLPEGITERIGLAIAPSNSKRVYTIIESKDVLEGNTYTQPFVVMPNLKVPYLPAEARAGYAFTKKYLRVGGQINVVLNNLDAQKKSLDAASSALTSAGNAALAAKVAGALRARERIFNAFTANYHHDEDSIQYPGQLREDVPAGGGGSQAAPTAAALEFTHRFDLEYSAGVKQYNDYVAGTLVPLSAELKAAGQKPIDGAESVSK